jgi:hypothetical protein
MRDLQLNSDEKEQVMQYAIDCEWRWDEVLKKYPEKTPHKYSYFNQLIRGKAAQIWYKKNQNKEDE